MLVETATLTLTSGQSADVEAALSRIAAYLESSSHCAGYLLTRDLAPQREPVFLLSAAWDTSRWCGLAWRYFADVFAVTGVKVHVARSSTLTAAAQAREAETAAARSHS
jgi:hypothetical protein